MISNRAILLRFEIAAIAILRFGHLSHRAKRAMVFFLSLGKQLWSIPSPCENKGKEYTP